MSADMVFTKQNLDNCLRELAKEYRLLNGKNTPAELILIGGASVLANYGFRDMTYDVDALIQSSSTMKEAINHVGDKLGLPNNWLNSDFIHTQSFSPKLVNYSVYYKTFSNILTVRTISGAYLVAMKLMSGRQYKNDISDIVGILREQYERDKPLTMEQINEAVCNLYNGWDAMPDHAKTLIESIISNNNLARLYRIYREKESENKNMLIEFREDYPNIIREDNLEDVLKNLNSRKEAARQNKQ